MMFFFFEIQIITAGSSFFYGELTDPPPTVQTEKILATIGLIA